METKMINPKLTADLVDDICEMYDDGVPPAEIAEWFGLRKVTVKELLKDVFPTDIYGNLLVIGRGKGGRVVLPKITEPDIFACQLALLKSIGDNAVHEFFEKVRENYPTVTLAIENTPASKDFYTTPELEIETDLESDWLVGNGYGEFYPMENSADYNRLG
jgi:uncharacterized protein (DUF433 family)